MTVIAMTREMGTLGKEVAAGVARKLGIEVVHHELVERHLAERLQLSESAVHRFLEGEASMWERWRIDGGKLSRFTAQEVLELAARGGVLIRGWGAAQLLRDVAHLIRLRVCAPMEKRVAEMKRRLGVDDAALARREIERNDEAHLRAVQRRFQADWRDPTGYDLTVNTGLMKIDAAVELIAQLAARPEYQETDAARAALAERLLLERVRARLEELAAEQPAAGGLEAHISGGEVTLTGVISRMTPMEEVLGAIHTLDGVKHVKDETTKVNVASGYYS